MSRKSITEMSDAEIEAWVREECVDLPEAMYLVGAKPYLYYTGREGFIEFEIAFRIKVRDYINNE